MSQESPAKSRKGKSVFSERVLGLFSEQITDELSAEAADVLRRRRLVDFTIGPGRVSAKVFDDGSGALRVEIAFKQLSAETWSGILDAFSERSYFPALLLAGRLPEEAEEIFLEHKAELFPKDAKQLIFLGNGKKRRTLDKNILSVMLRFCEKIDEDPFAVFLLRGKGREEILLELQKRRRSRRLRSVPGNAPGYQQVSYETAPPLVATLDVFWSTGPSASELSYNIRADELPASVLRWLDPLPLSGLEDSVDSALEQAYEKVARLAQSFGLGL